MNIEVHRALVSATSFTTTSSSPFLLWRGLRSCPSVTFSYLFLCCHRLIRALRSFLLNFVTGGCARHPLVSPKPYCRFDQIIPLRSFTAQAHAVATVTRFFPILALAFVLDLPGAYNHSTRRLATFTFAVHASAHA